MATGRRGIKAIQTRYRGYHFRSRLEARWAVWLDTLGISYQYEMQGFTLDGTNYLPDFWLPFSLPGGPADLGFWLEIKPTPLTDREQRLLLLLARHTHRLAYAFAGDPWLGEFIIYRCCRHTLDGASPVTCTVHLPTDCTLCRGTGIEDCVPISRVWRGHTIVAAARGPCSHCDGSGSLDGCLDEILHSHLYDLLNNASAQVRGAEHYGAALDVIQSAFVAARSARFEFGETPK